MRSCAIRIHCDTDSGMYLVDVPNLMPFITESTTEAEAVANASEAVRSHLAFLASEGEAIPEPSHDARSVTVAV